MNHLHESGYDRPVNVVIVDPDHLTLRPTKNHAIKFETSPGRWDIIMLSDKDLTELGIKVFNRWIERVFNND